MSFVKAICGSITHKKMSLSEGGIGEIEKEDIDYVMKEWERQGIIAILDTYEEAAKFKFKGIAALAEESLASLNPEIIDDRKGNQVGVVPFKEPTFDFSTHAPVSKESNYIAEPKQEEEVKTPTNPPAGNKTEKDKKP